MKLFFYTIILQLLFSTNSLGQDIEDSILESQVYDLIIYWDMDSISCEEYKKKYNNGSDQIIFQYENGAPKGYKTFFRDGSLAQKVLLTDLEKTKDSVQVPKFGSNDSIYVVSEKLKYYYEIESFRRDGTRRSYSNKSRLGITQFYFCRDGRIDYTKLVLEDEVLFGLVHRQIKPTYRVFDYYENGILKNTFRIYDDNRIELFDSFGKKTKRRRLIKYYERIVKYWE